MSLDQAAIDRGDFLPEEIEALKTEVPVEEPVVEEVAEEEAVEEAVETPEKDKAEEPARDEKGRFAGIPKARFDEAVGKEREAREAAERRAAELERRVVSAGLHGADGIADGAAAALAADKGRGHLHRPVTDKRIDGGRFRRNGRPSPILSPLQTSDFCYNGRAKEIFTQGEPIYGRY